MSFILDALKKSETDRQQQASAEFANVPTSDDTPRAPRWLWVLGALLAINLVVLLGLILRTDDPAPAAIAIEQQVLPADRDSERTNAATASFVSQVEQARRNQPKRQVAVTTTLRETAEPAADSEDTGTATVTTRNRSATETARLPTVQEVIVNGTVDIPDLHLDIHVYSDRPEERFVFINMSKQREKSQLSEGPTVEEITPDGVVLEYRGTSFVLRRD
ncbi:MAG: general secretion pathway protein GspB [Gammaproteobacteria bacterium]|nr:general secretion pathway protein GspB [Gammaproteobacteria bacterium]